MELPDGLFAIFDPKQNAGLNPFSLLDTFLDTEAVPFLFRSPHLSSEDYEQLTRDLAASRDELEFDFIVHRRVDLACELNLWGVHLPDGQDVAAARQKLRPDQILGVSVHSLEAGLNAQRQGADYPFLGSIFPSPLKPTNHPVVGLTTLQQLSQKVDIPVYAIGGIETGQLQSLIDHGAAGFSGLRCVYGDQDPEHQISMLQFLWEDLNQS